MRGLLPCEGAAETGLSARGVETGGLLRKPLAGALPGRFRAGEVDLLCRLSGAHQQRHLVVHDVGHADANGDIRVPVLTAPMSGAWSARIPHSPPESGSVTVWT